jgi:hypothetical protein
MKIAEFVDALQAQPGAVIQIMLPDGDFVPAHFHITEVGRVHKDFIDCGGTVRSTTTCVLQVWVADDVGHRLDTSKLARIIRTAWPLLGSADLPVEIEYQNTTVSQFPVFDAEMTPSGLLLHLNSKHTACLAPDRCGLPLVGGTKCC